MGRNGFGSPHVSVILTTSDRPRFLQTALACYRHQTYANRELIVVDDGERFPADSVSVAGAGGRLVRLPPDTILGEKLNSGAEAARGAWCQKMDDDDWYAPEFLTTMVSALREEQREVCRPAIAFVSPFLFFEVSRWQIRRSILRNAPGATLLFAREDWAIKPFRRLPQDEDVWFFHDQTANGARPVAVGPAEIFLAVRHRGSLGDRGHTWTHQGDGRTLEDYLTERPLYKRPEDLLPAWAVQFYRGVQGELQAGVNEA
jgi:glycosyltransferase involved in cell wall biosynthesis